MNKKFILINLGVTLIGLGLFFAITNSAFAADCGKQNNTLTLARAFQPLASFFQKIANDFGVKTSFATAPDPDTCGNDNVSCGANGLVQVQISWPAMPSTIYNWCSSTNPPGYVVYEVYYSSSPIGYLPGELGNCPRTDWMDIYPWCLRPAPYVSTGGTSVTIPSLSANTLYYWKVQGYCRGLPGGGGGQVTADDFGYAFNKPSGQFRTISCAPTLDFKGGGTIKVPDSINLYWATENADSCVASGAWSGSKEAGPLPYKTESITKSRGDYAFVLTCTGHGGSVSETVNAQVIQVPRCSFTANPTTIIPPATSTLAWSCSYADTCSIDQGIGSVDNVSGTTPVRPSSITIYTLNCSGLDGSGSYQATVNVGFEPKIKEVIPR